MGFLGTAVDWLLVNWEGLLVNLIAGLAAAAILSLFSERVRGTVWRYVKRPFIWADSALRKHYAPPAEPLDAPEPVRWRLVPVSDVVHIVEVTGARSASYAYVNESLNNTGNGAAFNVRLGDDGRGFRGPGSWKRVDGGQRLPLELEGDTSKPLVVHWQDATGEWFERSVYSGDF